MSDLPKGWAQCQLGDVVKIQNGYAFPSKDFQKEGIPLIKQSNLAGDKISLDKCVYLDPKYLTSKPDYVLKRNDVLIGMSGSIGKLCIYDSDEPALQNQRTGKIVPLAKEQISWRFIWEYLKTIEVQLLEKGKGLGVINVSASDIESLTLKLPPLNEQKRIVEKLEKLLGKVEAAQARLDKIPAILKRFRQAVLAAACSGKLTANPEKVLWGEEKFLNLLSESLCNGHSVITADVGFPVLRLTCLKKGLIDLGERKTGKWTEQDASKYIVKVNDFFISRGSGSLTHVGRGGLLTAIPDKVAFPDTLIRARVNHKQLLPAFLALVWESRIIREQVEDVAHTTAGIFKISQKQIEKFVFPVPPLEEQKEIVRRVEDLFKFADRIEARYKRARSYTDKLTQSILAKAFRGELVPQDSADEPASLLLERITKCEERTDKSRTKTKNAARK